MEDMPEVVEAATVRASSVIGGGGAVTKGVVSLKGVPRDNLEGGTLKSARVGLKHPLNEWVEVIQVGGLGEGCVRRIRLTCLVVLIPLLEHARFRWERRGVDNEVSGGAFKEESHPIDLPRPGPAWGIPVP
jgi:hypothetical protein